MSGQICNFTLNSGQVPDFPQSVLWTDQLRWALCVCDPGRAAWLKFLSGCFAAAIENGGLTEAQANAAGDILGKLHKAWSEGSLLCQLTPPSRERSARVDLSEIEPEGRA